MTNPAPDVSLAPATDTPRAPGAASETSTNTVTSLDTRATEPEQTTGHTTGEPRRAPSSLNRPLPVLLLAGCITVLVVGIIAAMLNRATTPPAADQPNTAADSPTGAADNALAPRQPFNVSPQSFFYQDVSDAPTHNNSEAIVDHLNQTIQNNWNGRAAVNSYQYGVSFFEANEATPKVDFDFWDCQNKGYLDDQFAEALRQVPVPAGTKPADGKDESLAIYDTSTDTLWEFWRAQQTDTGWQACWGGKTDNVSQTPGYFDGNGGATATGIAQSAGMVTIEEAKANQINHAMCLIVIEARDAAEYNWPAQRSDGNSDNPNAIEEGARMRLNPAVDVDSLGLTPFGRAVAQAAQKHGFVVCDKGGAVAVQTETGDQAMSRGEPNPWDAIYAGTEPHDQLAGFPWHQLQVIEPDWGKPANVD